MEKMSAGPTAALSPSRQLRRVGSELLNIHGQHDGAQLLDEEQHGAYLDRFGRTEGVLTAYQQAYGVMADLRGADSGPSRWTRRRRPAGWTASAFRSTS